MNRTIISDTIKNTVLLLILCIATQGMVNAQENLNLFEYWEYYSDVENAMYKTSCELAFDQLDERRKQISDLNDSGDYLNRQKTVQEKLTRLMGPLPDKTPLSSKVTGVIKKKDFRVEKVIYESIPGYYVTAGLFLPAKRKGKLPVIIYASGHTASGFRSETYQHIIINLVKKGFAVFAFDPIGQGERWQYFDEAGEKLLKGTTIEHSYPGAQCYVSGNSPTKYFVWDGIRAVDYLLTRKEIDPDRIGMTGRSGGGTQTAFTAAIDQRILAAATECFITNMEYVLKTIGPQDAEQNLYHMISEGLDHADLLEVRAPKPTLMITTTRDFFSIQGARETFKEVKQFFSSLDAEGQVSMVEDDEGHASTKKNREAMYAFFQKHLDNPGSPIDQEVEVFEEAELWATESGNVVASLDSKGLFDLNYQEVKGKVEQLELTRETGNGSAEIANLASSISGFEYPDLNHPAIFSGRTQLADYHLEQYLVPTGGVYQLPVAIYKPLADPKDEMVILFDDQGMERAARDGSIAKQLVQQGYTVLMADLPGIGSLGPGYLKGDAYLDNTSFNQWFAGILTAKSIVAMRAEDMVRLVHFIRSEISQTNPITAISVGSLASELLHAAVFNKDISRLVLTNPFLSYAEIALTKEYKPSFITSVVAGAINKYDLADLIGGLNSRDILVVNPLKATGETYKPGEADETLQYPMDIYQGQSASFDVSYGLDSRQVSASLLEWLK